jgi:hypothetical protein
MVRDAAAELDACAVCGSAAPDPGCWLCGPRWLRRLAADWEAEQARVAAERAVEDARVIQVMETFAAAESRVGLLSRYVERYAAAVADYEAGRAYQVELVADAMAREAAARGTRRGRPSVAAEVAAVLAVDGDPRIGRPALPGRDHTAELVGCSTRAVTRAWEALESVGWCRRVRQGGSLPLARRAELGRSMDRAEFQVRLLIAEDCAGHGPHVAAAAAVYAGLLARVAGLLAEAQAELAELRRAHGGRQEPGEVARRARLRHVVRQALSAPRLATAVRQAAQEEAGNFVSPSGGLQVSTEGSGSYWGLFSSENSPQSGHLQVRPIGRDGVSGASPTIQARDDLEWGCRRPQRPQRPRQVCVSGRSSRRQARRPEWAGWAYQVAAELRHIWDHLDGEPIHRIAATLGGRLADRHPDGPWTADRLVDVVEAGRSGVRLLDAPQRRLAYLRSLLDGLPDRYRRPDRVEAVRRAVVRDQAAELAARRTERAAGLAAQEAAARTAGSPTGRVARRVALYLARPVAVSSEACVGGCGTTGPDIQARTIGHRQVPLCGDCHHLLADTGQD